MHKRVPFVLVALALCGAFAAGVWSRPALNQAAAADAGLAAGVYHLADLLAGPLPEAIPGLDAKELGSTRSASVEVDILKTSIKAHRHAKSDEFVYIVSGSAHGVVGNSKVTVKAGDLIVIPKATVHSFEPDRGPLKAVVIGAPPSDPNDILWVK